MGRMTNSEPGADWIYVEEGAEYTPEQATRRFLSLPWGHQVKIMTALREDQGAAAACRILNHEGAMIFATRHTCQPAQPVTVAGEIVTAEPQSIESPA
jgi:hypothetical protein